MSQENDNTDSTEEESDVNKPEDSNTDSEEKSSDAVDLLFASEEESGDTDDEEESEGKPKSKLFLSLAVIVSLIAGAGGAVLYENWDRGQQAQTSLQQAIEDRNESVPINTDVLDYGDDSYALGIGSGDNYPSNGTFIFGSDEGAYDYTVDVYIDYSNSRSRDFFFSNNVMLQGLVESANAQLRIHPVPAEHPYSMYAAETMAQVMHKHPERAWEVNIALLQLSEDVLALEEPTPRDVLEMIESELNRHLDITDIDTELIMEGMFAEWIFANGSDERLQVGQYPPLVYSNGTLVESSVYYQPNNLRENILAPEEQESSDDDLRNGSAEESGGNQEEDETSEDPDPADIDEPIEENSSDEDLTDEEDTE